MVVKILPDVDAHPKVVEARAQVAQAQAALRKAEDEARQSAASDPIAKHLQAFNQAREAEREALNEAKADALANLRSEHLAAVRELSSTLEAAAEANARVRALEERAGQLRMNGSPGLPLLSWPELCEESATRATKLSQWLREARDYQQQNSVASQLKRKLRRRT